MELFNQLVNDYKIDRVPTDILTKIAFISAFILDIFISIKTMLGTGTTLNKALTVVGVTAVFLLGYKFIVYFIVYLLGVPLTLISKVLKVDTKSRRFLTYACERLDFLYYDEKIIGRKYYYETLDIIRDLECAE